MVNPVVATFNLLVTWELPVINVNNYPGPNVFLLCSRLGAQRKHLKRRQDQDMKT